MSSLDDFRSDLACPACGEALAALDGCAACGAEYASERGTPVLIPSVANRTVSFVFESARSRPTPAFERCFQYPARYGAAGADKPYHLDLAHLEVLEALSPGAKVLEIGCGRGHMADWLTSLGVNYVGTDIQTSHLPDDVRGPDVLSDAHFLPFLPERFDVVYSAAVSEHLACPILAFQNIVRVLKPGGVFLGNVSFLEPWHHNSFFHMTPLGAHEALVAAGLRVDKLWPGRDYTGFRAIARMGNSATRLLAPLGDLLAFGYRSGNRARRVVRPGKGKSRVHDDARVAGAIDWIARKPESPA